MRNLASYSFQAIEHETVTAAAKVVASIERWLTAKGATPDHAGTLTGLHILRHTFCSHLAMQGAPIRGVQELVGHQSLAMTQRYSHLTPASLDATIRLLDNRPAGGAKGTSWAPQTE